jgi:heme iron utilization protein
MKADTQSITEARTLMLKKDHAILSTHSLEYPGFPFGSVVPYALNDAGLPVVLISSIAQHTKNIGEDSKLSLTITATQGGDVQAAARLCLLGHLKLMDSEEEKSQQRYFNYFEQSKLYFDVHDFSFYVFEPVAVRYIGGFGKIFWVDVEDFFLSNPFFGSSEQGMLSHMNEHHSASIRAYCSHYGKLNVSGRKRVLLVGIDAEGIDIKADEERLRIEFPKRISSPNEARELLTEMSHTAMAALLN